MTSIPTSGPPTSPPPLRSQTALLEEILARLDRMERRLDLLATASDNLPGLGAMMTDVIDEKVRQAQDQGVDVAAALASLGDLVIQLAQPRTLKVLVGLVHELPRLEPLLAQLDQIPGLIALAVDTVDELIAKAQANGHRVEDIVRNAFLAAGKVVGLLESPQVVGLLESGILAPEALAVVSQASHALAAASAGPSGRAGLFALWRASRKPEFQRATDFLVRFAGAFGHRLEGGPAALPGAQDQLKLPHLP